MSVETKTPVLIYTEQTPNPESLKFVTNKMLYPNQTADFREEALAREWSPLAAALFDLPFVKGVYIASNFVSVTKQFNYQWEDVMLNIKSFIKKYLEQGGEIVKSGFEDAKASMGNIDMANAGEVTLRIKELIDTYVKPAVEMDGGNIEFQSYKNGVVSVLLQGSCSGCPSSTVTLKSGIEGMLKRMVPEVKEVVAYMG